MMLAVEIALIAILWVVLEPSAVLVTYCLAIYDFQLQLGRWYHAWIPDVKRCGRGYVDVGAVRLRLEDLPIIAEPTGKQ